MSSGKGISREFFVFAGFLSGLALMITLYIVLFRINQSSFTFREFRELHLDHPFLFLLLLMPIGFAAFMNVLGKRFSFIESQHIDSARKQLQKIEKAREISNQLASGNYSLEIDPQGDKLQESLEMLRHHLNERKLQEESRINADSQRNWISEGLALFGNILRKYSSEPEEMANQIIGTLVKYLNANQGGFFIREEDASGSAFLDLKACYAYDRKKFADRRINWGDGLIGTCALEKKSVFIRKIPENYLYITSGLGKSNPRNLLLVPMISNNKVNGVLEIASFQSFEPHEIDFVEKVAESIAITMENLQNSIRTSMLLKETQAQAEALSIQEERMRQNMEELKATQEQAARQAEKFISFTNSVNHTMIRAEYDKDGMLIYANTKFLKKLGYSGNREVEGKPISMFIHEKDRDWFWKIWEGLSKGGQHFEGYMKHVTKQGQDLWTMATYTCVRKDDGTVERILFLAIDTTEQKKQSLDYESQISAINRLNIKVEFAPDGKYLDANELFINTLKYPVKELVNLSVFDFIEVKDLETFNDMWEKVITGTAFQGQIRMLTRFRDEKWFRASFTAVNDMYNEVAKVIFLATEISNEKIMEVETRRQTEKMKIQEEKMRLAGMELKKKLDEANAKWDAKLTEALEIIDLHAMLDEISGIALLSIDSSGLIVYMNQQASALFSRERTNLQGMSSLILLETLGFQDPFLKDFVTAPTLPENHPRVLEYTEPGKPAVHFRLFVWNSAGKDSTLRNLALIPA